jgi:hypothetical protein
MPSKQQNQPSLLISSDNTNTTVPSKIDRIETSSIIIMEVPVISTTAPSPIVIENQSDTTRTTRDTVYFSHAKQLSDFDLSATTLHDEFTTVTELLEDDDASSTRRRSNLMPL